MAVGYGDQWTNLIHPFVAIPVLLLTRLPAAKVLAHSFLLFLVAGVPLTTATFAGIRNLTDYLNKLRQALESAINRDERVETR
jgi:hypothetical protein